MLDVDQVTLSVDLASELLRSLWPAWVLAPRGPVLAVRPPVDAGHHLRSSSSGCGTSATCGVSRTSTRTGNCSGLVSPARNLLRLGALASSLTEDNRPLGVGVKKKVAGWLMALARIAVLNPELFRMAVEDAHRMYGEQVKNEYPWNHMVGAYAADVCADSVEAGGNELVRGSGHGARGGVAVCAGGGCGEFRSGGYLGGHEMGPPRLRLPMALEILSAKL